MADGKYVTRGALLLLLGLSACSSQAVTPTRSTPSDLTAPPPSIPSASPEIQSKPVCSGHLDATYEIDGIPVALVNGVSEIEAAPGSASKILTRNYGLQANGDLNGDGRSDIAFLLTQSGGGSGTFYYLVAAICTDSGYDGSNGIFLGDRILPISVAIEDGSIVVTYKDRLPEETFAAPPSVTVERGIGLTNGMLVELGPA